MTDISGYDDCYVFKFLWRGVDGRGRSFSLGRQAGALCLVLTLGLQNERMKNLPMCSNN